MFSGLLATLGTHVLILSSKYVEEVEDKPWLMKFDEFSKAGVFARIE